MGTYDEAVRRADELAEKIAPFVWGFWPAVTIIAAIAS